MSARETYRYQGQELDVFAHAQNWKRYWISRISRWVRGDVLEVGAGLGANTALLQNSNVQSWVCLEPDAELVAKLSENVADVSGCSVVSGTIASVSGRQFDSILYIDVLEHIELDRDELAAAANLLLPGGNLIVLAPAHQFLFSKFDSTIGHHRRYNKASLRGCSPGNCRLETTFYLDCMGMLALLGKRAILPRRTPTVEQIKIWDACMVPIARVLDPLLGYRFGKTIVGVWTRSG